MAQAEAFWITGERHGEIRPCDLGAPGPGEVMVRSLYSGISRGTESLVFSGKVPPSQYRLMRAPHQEGELPWPVKYGYASVGQVEAGPERLLGQPVFCLYPHQSAYVVPEDSVLPLPTGLPPERAVLAANMEAAVNGLWDAAPRPGDRIAVVGAGVVGCLIAYVAGRIPGCEVQLIDPDAAKADVAAAIGVGFAAPETADAEADLVIHASGQPDGLKSALTLAAFEAVVLEMSWYGNREVPLPLGENFHSKRLELRASQVSALAGPQRARWTHRRRLALALSLLDDPCLDRLITGESAFRDLPETMVAVTDQPGGVLCHRVTYGE